jgi:hypothetical protein
MKAWRKSRSTLACLRAAAWAFRASARIREELAATPASAPLTLPSVPDIAETGERGVAAALRLTRANCLVEATVRQAWYAAHGDLRDVVIGVTAPSAGFAAHAWLDGDSSYQSEGFHELLRRPASAPR